MSKTVLLLSGGLDSIAVAYWKRPDLAITIDYGQVCAEAEFRAAKQVCEELRVEHYELRVDCGVLGSGDLAARPALALAPEQDWWPFRNQLLITLAAMKAIALGVTELWLGTVKGDRQHADGSPQFVKAISDLIRNQEGAISIEAPAIEMTSVELIEKSRIPVPLLAWGHSCHTSNWACGRCRGCNKHRSVMEEIGCGAY